MLYLCAIKNHIGNIKSTTDFYQSLNVQVTTGTMNFIKTK